MTNVIDFPEQNRIQKISPDLRKEVFDGIRILAKMDNKGRDILSPLRDQSAENIISILEKVL